MTTADEKETVAAITVDANAIPFATDGLSAPVIYSDVVRGVQISQETTKINLVQHRSNAITDEIAAVHAATIVVPTSQLPAWAAFFSEIVKNPPFAHVERAIEEDPNGTS